LRVAAVQMQPIVGDVDANLQAAQLLATEALSGGARLVVLPEFFTTGMAFVPDLARCALPWPGPATELLSGLAACHNALVGGSFLCRDGDGEVRNAFCLAGSTGILGRHDKDRPTMWENAFYVGGRDDGVISTSDGLRVGVALCWEMMRSPTVRRLRGRVDVVLAGSAWWSVPSWPPASLTRRWEVANRRNARASVTDLAGLVGAPVVHASHCGEVVCRLPSTPLTYRGHYEGPTAIVAAGGSVLADRDAAEGPGIAAADMQLGAAPTTAAPKGFWLRARGPVPTVAWHYQRAHGRRWYRRHVTGQLRRPSRLPASRRMP